MILKEPKDIYIASYMRGNVETPMLVSYDITKAFDIVKMISYDKKEPFNELIDSHDKWVFTLNGLVFIIRKCKLYYPVDTIYVMMNETASETLMYAFKPNEDECIEMASRVIVVESISTPDDSTRIIEGVVDRSRATYFSDVGKRNKYIIKKFDII